MYAIKAVYNRKTQGYDVYVILKANPLLAHEGWLVFDDTARAESAILHGELVTHLSPPARDALVAWLRLAK